MQNLLRFIKKYHCVFLFLILEWFAMMLIVRNTNFQSSSILSWSTKQSGRLYTISDAVSSYFKLAKTNRLLSEENAKLRGQIENSYIQYSKQVFIIEDTVYKQQYNYIESRVLSNSHTKRNNYLILNKGALQGIKPDMAVISSNGIVGSVINVSDNFSNVMSVLHSDSRHSVKVKRTNSQGILLWNGGSYKEGVIQNVPSSYPLEIGDTIITSGYSQDFPEGILVGTVSSFDKDPSSGFYTIYVEFSTDYNTLEYIYVVKNLYKEEELKLIEEREEDEQ